MDNELFDLCKQVYEKTGWDKGRVITDNPKMSTYNETNVLGYVYTSDYLLEKLPSVVQDTDDKIFRVITMWINGDGSTHAGYAEPYAHDDKYAHSQTSDRMVNTLLKLTLALSEAGEL